MILECKVRILRHRKLLGDCCWHIACVQPAARNWRAQAWCGEAHFWEKRSSSSLATPLPRPLSWPNRWGESFLMKAFAACSSSSALQAGGSKYPTIVIEAAWVRVRSTDMRISMLQQLIDCRR